MEGNLSLLEQATEVHPLLKGIFQNINQNLPFAGRIKHFLQNWIILTKDKNVLNIVKGWEIPLLRKPIHHKQPHSIQMKEEEIIVVDSEITNMLGKGAIRIAMPKEDQMLSNIFVRSNPKRVFDP